MNTLIVEDDPVNSLLLQEILKQYGPTQIAENGIEAVDAVRTALQAGAASSAEHQAHTIKGASATCGGEALRAVALKMEEAARDGDLESVADLLPELEMQFIRLKEAMNGFINQK